MTLLAVLLFIYIMNIINPKISMQIKTFPSCANFSTDVQCILNLIKESISRQEGFVSKDWRI